MMDQYFGHKELYEVVLRAKEPMYFGSRYIEADEPVLYFDDINMSLITEQNRPVFARGGWQNMPRVIWDERSEVSFQLTDGVMSSVGMSILLGSNVISEKDKQPLYIHMKEGPKPCSFNNVLDLKHWPVEYPIKKTFIFTNENNMIQKKIYGRKYRTNLQIEEKEDYPRLEIFSDKNYEKPITNGGNFVIDYYYKYEDEALIYSVQKERFNGLFTLEAKFYSKDENEGNNYTNVLFMPKVRIVSDINLRLGERADPTVSTFNIIGLPETVGDQKNLIMEITRLGEDIDADI